MTLKFAPPRPPYPSFDSLIGRVALLPYWDRRIFLRKRFGPERYPRFRYKYKALASDATDPRAIQLRDILVESRLWLSSPLDFNDPFDMTAQIILEAKTPQDLRNILEERLAASGKRWKERQRMVSELMAKGRTNLLATARRIILTHLGETGVFSWAGDPRSVLMWSHYGDHHTGICMQFEVARDVETMCQAVRMEYVANYPVLNWAEDTAKQIKEPLTHKFKDWAYEREWRIIWPDGAHTYLPFEPSALVGVIFGCRASDKAIEIVRALLDERTTRRLPPVKIYRAEKHASRYSLVLRRIE